jgi:hypothetical protein
MNSEIFNTQRRYIDVSPLFVGTPQNSFSHIFSDPSFASRSDANKGSFFNFEDLRQKQNIENQEILENKYPEKNFEMEMEIKEKQQEEENSALNIDNIIGNLETPNLPLPILEIKDKKEDLKNEADKNTNKSTDDKTKSKNNNISKCLFGLSSQKPKLIEPRVDYAIKQFKVYSCKFLKEYGNQLIKECNFKNNLKKLKLFAPSYKYFTGNSNEKENKMFLDFTVEEIFSYPKDKSKKDNRLQQKNKDIIKKFIDYIEETYPKEVPEPFRKLQNFFRMTYRDIIVLFYDSEQFIDYSSDPKTQFLDEQFTKSKGFSLMEKSAFFKLMKNYNKKTE